MTQIWKRCSSSIKNGPVPLAFSMYGDNTSSTPTIILHGVLGSKNNWHSLSKMINERTNLKVFALDQRNHGESPHTDQMNIDLLSQDVELFLHSHDFSKVNLIGHSLGGRACIKFAVDNPEKVERLVVVDVSHLQKETIKSNQSEVLGIGNTIYNLDLSSATSLSEARKIAEKALVPVCSSKPTRLFLCTNINKGINNRYYWRFNIETILKALKSSDCEIASPLVGQFHGPTSFIAGSESNYVQPEDHDEIQNTFPNATFSYIQGAGHFVHSEKPHQFLDVLVPFLTKDFSEKS